MENPYLNICFILKLIKNAIIQINMSQPIPPLLNKIPINILVEFDKKSVKVKMMQQ